jgi:hypothetical protein
MILGRPRRVLSIDKDGRRTGLFGAMKDICLYRPDNFSRPFCSRTALFFSHRQLTLFVYLLIVSVCKHIATCTSPLSPVREVPLYNFFGYIYTDKESRDSAVGIASGYGLDDRGVRVRVPVGSRIFSSSRRPDSPNLVHNGYRGYSGRGVMLTTQLQLVPRSRKCAYIYIHFSLRLHGVALN